MPYRVPAQTRKALRELALLVRRHFAKDDEPFPVLRVVENIQWFDSQWHFEVAGREEFAPNEHGATIPSEKVIKIREDIYVGASNGRGRDRMTVAHELGHFLLHEESVVLCQIRGKIPAYKDPEWQAKCFAGELLIPFPAIAGMSAEEIVAKYGVSKEAARYALRKA